MGEATRTRIRPIHEPHGVFVGCNLVTQTADSYYKLQLGHAELASGDFLGRTWWGVTVRPDPDWTRSRVFTGREEALDYVESLS